MSSIPKLPSIKEKPALFTLDAPLTTHSGNSSASSSGRGDMDSEKSIASGKKRMKRSESSSSENSIKTIRSVSRTSMKNGPLIVRHDVGGSKSDLSSLDSRSSSRSEGRLDNVANYKPDRKLEKERAKRAQLAESLVFSSEDVVPKKKKSRLPLQANPSHDSLHDDPSKSEGLLNMDPDDGASLDPEILQKIQQYSNSESIEYDGLSSDESSSEENDEEPQEDPTFITAVASSLPPELVEEREAQRKEIELALKSHKEETEALRKQLSEFLTDVKSKIDEEGNPLVEFPQSYDAIIDYLKESGDYANIPNDVVKQLIDASSVTNEEAMSEITENDDLNVGLHRIRKLDLLLHESELKFKELNKKVERIVKRDKKNAKMRKNEKLSLRKLILSKPGEEALADDLIDDNSDEATNVEYTDVPFPDVDVYLTKFQQERIEKLLADENIELGIISPGEGFLPTQEELERMKEIDNRLKEIDPDFFSENILDTETMLSSARSSLGIGGNIEDLNGDDRTGRSALSSELELEEVQEKEVQDPSHPFQMALRDIDEKISKLHMESSVTKPKLTEEQLQALLMDLKDEIPSQSTSTEGGE